MYLSYKEIREGEQNQCEDVKQCVRVGGVGETIQQRSLIAPQTVPGSGGTVMK